MADEDVENKVKAKKEREPILFVCSIILLAACISVAAIYISDELVPGSDGTQATAASTATCDYVLSFYDYAGEDGAVIYQSTSPVDDAKTKSSDYTNTGRPISVDLSKSDYLSGFQDALIGLKAGDTAKVAIAATDGYSVPCKYGTTALDGITMNRTVTMRSADFNSKYGFTPLGTCTVPTDYGWDAVVTPNSNGTCMLAHQPVQNGEYSQTIDGMAVSYKVTAVGDTDITYTLILPDGIETAVIGSGGDRSPIFTRDGTEYHAIKEIKAVIGSQTVYLVGYDGANYLYKTCSAQQNMDLYFVITVVSVK